jgi:hypothetical protein
LWKKRIGMKQTHKTHQHKHINTCRINTGECFSCTALSTPVKIRDKKDTKDTKDREEMEKKNEQNKRNNENKTKQR